MNDKTNGAPRAPGSTHDSGAPARPGGAAHDSNAPRRSRAEERIASLDTSPTALARRIEELEQQLAQATQEAAEAKAGWQRSAADFANFRRRTEQERADLLGLASDSLLLKVVALADDFDRALELVPQEGRGSPWLEGIAAIDRKLRQLLESEGVTPMQAQGRPFDPREHEAVAHEDTAEAPDGSVLRELQRGYYVRDRVLRPALVAVARNEEDTDAAASGTRE